MAVKKSVIETGVDKLVRLVNSNDKISIKAASKQLGVSIGSIEEWADFLEEEGLLDIKSKFSTVYLIPRQMDKKVLVERVNAVKEEKESLMRRVESSINSLERDHEEMRKVDYGFKAIKTVFEESFKKLSVKLDRLENYRKSYHVIHQKRKVIEDEYEHKIKFMEQQLEKDRKAYGRFLKDVESEMETIKNERKNVDSLKKAEKQIESKVDEINKILDQVKSEIQKGNIQLDDDEKRIAKSELAAQQVRKHVEEGSKNLDSVSKDMQATKKDLEKMEKEFINDVGSLDKGELKKISAYRDGKQMIGKFKKFFAMTKKAEDMMHSAEKEEGQIMDAYEGLSRKVKAFSVVASLPEIKKQMTSLKTDLKKIEDKRSHLSTSMRNVSKFVKSIVK
ncbi:hypothetical protein HQ545_05415 [Candidatus Woesearchaeota archaeon]|nr:hypothetical protein [Candidatus Woesearchaeota archaeon]